jgi:hypothetical protein
MALEGPQGRSGRPLPDETPSEGAGDHKAVVTAMEPRTITFTREDGSQVLVTLWPEGVIELAERPHQGAVWGPSIDGVWETPYMTTEETHRILRVKETL